MAIAVLSMSSVYAAETQGPVSRWLDNLTGKVSKKEQEYAHPAFNNLFLSYKYDENIDAIIVKRRNREIHDKNLYLIAKIQTKCEQNEFFE